MKSANKFFGVLRILLGWIFLWPFFDKMFGLGFATPADRAWIDGASPTAGFLGNATRGPFADLFASLAGQAWVDWLFMAGLLLIGLALILGVGVYIASYAGALMLMLMWLAVLPPEHNPVIDDHVIYSIALLHLAYHHAGDVYGLGKWWSKTDLVKTYPILR